VWCRKYSKAEITPPFEKEKRKARMKKNKPGHFLMIFDSERSVEMQVMTTSILDKALEERL